MLSLFYELGNRAWSITVAVTVVLFFYAIIYAFPNTRLAALQQARDVAEQENQAFCEKHGMPFGTREHTVCAEDLMDIRLMSANALSMSSEFSDTLLRRSAAYA
jgi:hypothetical protein